MEFKGKEKNTLEEVQNKTQELLKQGRDKKPAKQSKSRHWVMMHKLLKKLDRKEWELLKAYMKRKDLFNGDTATKKAYDRRFVKLIEGKERWNKGKYINMLRADKVVERLHKQGKPVDKRTLRRAVLDDIYIN